MALAEQRVREPSLSTAQREELEQDLAAMPAHAEGPDLLHNGFVALLQRWDDEAAHRALLQQADALSQLPALGMRYRTVLQRIPEDPAAKRAQQRIVQLAFASLPVRGEHTSENRPVSVLVMGMVGLFALALSVWYWMVYAPGE